MMTNTVKEQLEELLQREMTRQEFIKVIGAGFLVIIGVSSLIQNLNKVGQLKTVEKQSTGYGGSPYGR